MRMNIMPTPHANVCACLFFFSPKGPEKKSEVTPKKLGRTLRYNDDVWVAAVPNTRRMDDGTVRVEILQWSPSGKGKPHGWATAVSATGEVILNIEDEAPRFELKTVMAQLRKQQRNYMRESMKKPYDYKGYHYKNF